MAEDGDSILLQPGGVYAPQGQLVVRRAVQIATARGGAPAEIHLVEGIQLSSQSGCHFQRLRLRVVASAIAGLQLISGGRALLQDVDFEISETSQDCTALLVQGDTCEALLFRCRINAERLAAEADESEPEAFLQWESSRQLSVGTCVGPTGWPSPEQRQTARQVSAPVVPFPTGSPGLSPTDQSRGMAAHRLGACGRGWYRRPRR